MGAPRRVRLFFASQRDLRRVCQPHYGQCQTWRTEQDSSDLALLRKRQLFWTAIGTCNVRRIFEGVAGARNICWAAALGTPQWAFLIHEWRSVGLGPGCQQIPCAPAYSWLSALKFLAARSKSGALQLISPYSNFTTPSLYGNSSLFLKHELFELPRNMISCPQCQCDDC